MKSTIIITDEKYRQLAIDTIRRAPLGHQVVIEPQIRTKKQNRRMWALVADVARAHILFANRDDWDANDWKRWLASGFNKVKKDEAIADRFGMGGNNPPPEERLEFTEGIEGELVQIDELSTRYWDVKKHAEFCEYILAWGSMKGVEWTPYGEEPL